LGFIHTLRYRWRTHFLNYWEVQRVLLKV
jgi:hypothetical protein